MDKKIILALLLIMFITGILVSPVMAAKKSKNHTYKYGKLKCSITDKQYKKLKRAKIGTSVKAKVISKIKYVKMDNYYQGEYLGKKRYKLHCYIYKLAKNSYWQEWDAGGWLYGEKKIKHF